MTDRKEPRSLDEVKRLLRSLEETPSDAQPAPFPSPLPLPPAAAATAAPPAPPSSPPPAPVAVPLDREAAKPALSSLQKPSPPRPTLPDAGRPAALTVAEPGPARTPTPMVPVPSRLETGSPIARPAAMETRKPPSRGPLVAGLAVAIAVGGVATAALLGVPPFASLPVTKPSPDRAARAADTALAQTSSTETVAIPPAPVTSPARPSVSGAPSAGPASEASPPTSNVAPVATVATVTPADRAGPLVEPSRVAAEPAAVPPQASRPREAASSPATKTAGDVASGTPAAAESAARSPAGGETRLAQAPISERGPSVSAVPPAASDAPRPTPLTPGDAPAIPRQPSTASPSPAQPQAQPEPTASPTRPPAATPAPSPPPSVVPPQMSEPARIDEAEIAKLIADGKAQLTSGNVAVARLLFQRAANSGNGEAARLLGDTFDPAKLFALGVRGTAGDMEKAIYWYERADELGDPQAKARLAPLGSR